LSVFFENSLLLIVKNGVPLFHLAWQKTVLQVSCCSTAKKFGGFAEIIQHSQESSCCCRLGVLMGRSTPSVCPMPTI